MIPDLLWFQVPLQQTYRELNAKLFSLVQKATTKQKKTQTDKAKENHIPVLKCYRDFKNLLTNALFTPSNDSRAM